MGNFNKASQEGFLKSIELVKNHYFKLNARLLVSIFQSIRTNFHAQCPKAL